MQYDTVSWNIMKYHAISGFYNAIIVQSSANQLKESHPLSNTPWPENLSKTWSKCPVMSDVHWCPWVLWWHFWCSKDNGKHTSVGFSHPARGQLSHRMCSSHLWLEHTSLKEIWSEEALQWAIRRCPVTSYELVQSNQTKNMPPSSSSIVKSTWNLNPTMRAL